MILFHKNSLTEPWGQAPWPLTLKKSCGTCPRGYSTLTWRFNKENEKLVHIMDELINGSIAWRNTILFLPKKTARLEKLTPNGPFFI